MPIKKVYQQLRRRYGPQHWWPAESTFEVMLGAVLTQNTAWVNVERAIENLKQASALTPQAIVNANHNRLAKWLKPSGYFNVKAKRLRNFCSWYINAGEYASLKYLKTIQLRERLLEINGIGPETADDILLYAFNRKVFVIDAYTKRIFSRIGIIKKEIDYESLRELFEHRLGIESVKMFNEYHALIVLHGKDVCKKRPRCNECCLSDLCAKVGLG